MLWMLGEAGVLWRTRDPSDATLVEPVSPPALRQLARLAIRERFWLLDDEQRERTDETEEPQRRQSLKDSAHAVANHQASQSHERRRDSGAAPCSDAVARDEGGEAQSASAKNEATSGEDGGGECAGACDGSPAGPSRAGELAAEADCAGLGTEAESEALAAPMKWSAAPRWGLTFEEFVTALPLPAALKRFVAIDALDLLQLD